MFASPSSTHSTSGSSSRSLKYEVFLSFRGEDTRKTFVDHLYSSLVDHQINAYKDDQTLPRGESIHLSLFKAIEESQIAVIIFSKDYAGSSWCLEELEHIMKCKEDRQLIVIPIFYDVEPSEVRNLKRSFGEAFAKQEANNATKSESWRKALVDACNIAGWEVKNNANGHESKVIKEIVDTISDRLFYTFDSDVDEDLVGIMTRLSDLESQLHIGSNEIIMVGIWGLGGSGKTTLAYSLYKKISCHFQGHCIIDNIRMESDKHGLKTLQEKVISGIFKTRRWVPYVETGKDMLRSRLCKTKVLILLDDVNDLDQLQALAGSDKWFGSGSLIIITTRDEHLLRSHKVKIIYEVKLLSDEEAIRLFNMHAYNGKDPVEDYDKLSLRAVSYAAGLPLALKVLGSFLYDKDKNEWLGALEKFKDIPDPKVIDVLKISYDGLETYQKELFLDIACMWRWKTMDDAMEILDACDYHPKIGIKVLRQKALISIVDGRFDMHDLVQEMGHYIVRGEYPKNPEKHSRVWKDEEIKNMFSEDTTMDYHNIKAIRFENHYYDHDLYLLPFCKIVSNMDKLRCLMVKIKEIMRIVSQSGKKVKEYNEGPAFLSNELRYIDWAKYPASPFPDSFQPMKLVVLKLSSMQKELWKDYKRLPHLKVLQLSSMKNLLRTPDFDGLPSLQKLTLHCCDKLEEIHPSLENSRRLVYLCILGCYMLRRFPRFVKMGNLKTLQIIGCRLKDGEIPTGISELYNLQELTLRNNKFSRLDFSLLQLTQLEVLDLSYCDNLVELPELPSNLATLRAESCFKLTSVGDCHKKCKQLCEVSLHGGGVVNDGDILLQSMLEGNAIENGHMLLRLRGDEVAKGFTPPLVNGGTCKVKLPENWCNDFCGFLICCVLPFGVSSVVLSMNDVMSGNPRVLLIMERYEPQIEKIAIHDTLVWYVSFDSLRNTTWWNQRYKALLFDIEGVARHDMENECCGVGVRLVDQKSTTSRRPPHYPHHAPNFKIEDDTTTALTISLKEFF